MGVLIFFGMAFFIFVIGSIYSFVVLRHYYVEWKAQLHTKTDSPMDAKK